MRQGQVTTPGEIAVRHSPHREKADSQTARGLILSPQALSWLSTLVMVLMGHSPRLDSGTVSISPSEMCASRASKQKGPAQGGRAGQTGRARVGGQEIKRAAVQNTPSAPLFGR
jgi:hypothetical protein